MSASFAGLPISIDADSVQVPFNAAANVGERHIPGGDRGYVDIGGRAYPRLTLSLKWTNLQQYESFEALLGRRDTLVAFDGSLDVCLLSLQRQVYGAGAGGSSLGAGALTAGGAVIAACEFLVYAVSRLPAKGTCAVPPLASFQTLGGVGFDLFALPDVARKLAYSFATRHIPGSNRDWVDSQGPGLPHVTTNVVFADSLRFLQFAAGALGAQGTLSLREGDFAAIPVSLSRTDHSAQARGECTASIDWLILPAGAVVRAPWWRVRYTFGGSMLESTYGPPWANWWQLSDVYACSVTYGYSTRVAEATLTVPYVDPGLGYWSPIDIAFGADPEQASQPSRFVGYVVEFDSTHAPNSVDIICRGELYKAQICANQTLQAADLSNNGVGRTDVEIVALLLGNAPVGGPNGPLGANVWLDSAVFTSGGIKAGTPAYQGSAPPKLGTVNSQQYLWTVNQSALDCLDQLEQIGLGFRTYDTVGGLVTRSRVSIAYPRQSMDAFTGPVYEEGRNILSATVAASVLEQYHASAVSTTKSSKISNDGTWFGVSRTSGSARGQNVEALSSMWIEKQYASDPGEGLSCEEVATWRLGEISPILAKIQLTTGDDDHGAVQPGSLIRISAPLRLGLDQLCWVQAVQPSFDDTGAFSIQITCWTAVTTTGAAGVPQ